MKYDNLPFVVILWHVFFLGGEEPDVANKGLDKRGLRTKLKKKTTVELQEWFDELSTWSPADFGNLKYIVMPTWALWLPDLYIFNKLVLCDLEKHTLF